MARPTLGREWATVDCLADPVSALTFGAWVMDTANYIWWPVPASFSRTVLETGALRHIRRVVELGAVHAGRCVAGSRPSAVLCTHDATLLCTAWNHRDTNALSALK